MKWADISVYFSAITFQFALSYFPFTIWLFLNIHIIMLFVVKNSILVAYYFNVNLKMTQPYKKYLEVAHFKNKYVLLLFFKYVVT